MEWQEYLIPLQTNAFHNNLKSHVNLRDKDTNCWTREKNQSLEMRGYPWKDHIISLQSLYNCCIIRRASHQGKRKLRWYGRICHSSDILQGTVNGARRQARQRRRGNDNTEGRTGLKFTVIKMWKKSNISIQSQYKQSGSLFSYVAIQFFEVLRS